MKIILNKFNQLSIDQHTKKIHRCKTIIIQLDHKIQARGKSKPWSRQTTDPPPLQRRCWLCWGQAPLVSVRAEVHMNSYLPFDCNWIALAEAEYVDVSLHVPENMITWCNLI